MEQGRGFAPYLRVEVSFRELVLAADVSRGGEIEPPIDPEVIFKLMLQRLANDPLWG